MLLQLLLPAIFLPVAFAMPAPDIVIRHNNLGNGHGKSSGKMDLLEASFVLVGDSTTANSTTPKSGGWGNGFCASLEADTWCSNRAANGRSTGTIVTDGFWDLALQDVRQETAKGKVTFVTIQFGHNDAGKTGLPPSSMGSNLTQFVHQLRDLSPLAIPLLVTPLTRRSFIGDTGKLSDDLIDWAAETREVAKSVGVPLIPLHEVSASYVEHIGPEASWRLNNNDYTHLGPSGTALFGRMMADMVQTFALNYPGVPKIRSPFIPHPELSEAIIANKQFFYNERISPPMNVTAPAGLCKA